MKALQANKRNFIEISKKYFAAGGKKKTIDPNLREFDVCVIGGLNGANMIKYYQHKHFHGTIAGFCARNKFAMEHLYDHLFSGNTQPYKYLAMPFSSNFETNEAKCVKDRVTGIDPNKNEIVTDKGDVYKYKTLVLNTGLDQLGSNLPYLKGLIDDDYAKSRVFIQEPSNPHQVNRNTRMFFMHKDGDFLIYLPKFPSRGECYDHWYLKLENYLARGWHLESRPRSYRIKVITPNDCLLRFPFANEVMLDEIEQRGNIGKYNKFNKRCSFRNGNC
jgi:hypothetical protein